ncbi:MAG TPA: outer membrane beta-barrel protein [Chitinophagaceae bacterium]|nr:outer membrane beta-barrel protein [Chitinophagaceae bacterium]
MSDRLIFLIILITFCQVVQAQKGEVSVSAGPLLSLGTKDDINVQLKTGLGLEVSVQYNFTDRSAVVAEAGLASFSIKNRIGPDTGTRYRETINSFKIGYRYTFGATGIYSNILYGIDKYPDNSIAGTSTISILGVGRRFTLKNLYFIDAGFDFISSISPRFNIKAVFGLRLPKDK